MLLCVDVWRGLCHWSGTSPDSSLSPSRGRRPLRLSSDPSKCNTPRYEIVGPFLRNLIHSTTHIFSWWMFLCQVLKYTRTSNYKIPSFINTNYMSRWMWPPFYGMKVFTNHIVSYFIIYIGESMNFGDLLVASCSLAIDKNLVWD